MSIPIDKYRYNPATGTRRATFQVAARPHIMMKLKRLIPQGSQNYRTGELFITATKELGRDLEWFCSRHPLEPCDAESLAHLTKLADEHRSGEEQIGRILEGEISDYGCREPALKPRDYQLVPRAMLLAQGFLFLGDDVGLGKTMGATLLFTDPSTLRGLVVAPTHLVGQWQEELKKYYPWLRTHILRQGTPYTEKQVRVLDDLNTADVIITNYHKLGGWGDYLRGKITTVVFDEAHELRTGGGTGKYIAASMIAYAARYRVGCSATPVYNYGDEIHNVISVLNPDVLGTAEEFTKQWGGKKIPEPRALGAYLRDSGIMLRRTRKEVGRELPPVSSMVQPVETDHKQLEVLLADGIVAMAAKVLDTQTSAEDRFTLSGQLDMRLRKATGEAKAPYVAEFAKMLLAREKKIILVGHHHAVYDVWRRELAAFNPVEYTGRQSEKQKREAVRQFVEGDSRVFIMALRSGAGLNGLQLASSTMVIGELDWSPAQHHQIIGRLARDGQQDPVAVFYMLSDGGADPPMAELLDLKRRISEPINDPDADIVQPSPQEALNRVRALAKGVLRQHGVGSRQPPPAPVMPAPVPGSGELFSTTVVQNSAAAPTANQAERTGAASGDASRAAVDAAAERVEAHRVLAGRPRPDHAAPAATRDDLRARLTGDHR